MPPASAGAAGEGVRWNERLRTMTAGEVAGAWMANPASHQGLRARRRWIVAARRTVDGDQLGSKAVQAGYERGKGNLQGYDPTEATGSGPPERSRASGPRRRTRRPGTRRLPHRRPPAKGRALTASQSAAALVGPPGEHERLPIILRPLQRPVVPANPTPEPTSCHWEWLAYRRRIRRRRRNRSGPPDSRTRASVRADPTQSVGAHRTWSTPE